MDLDEVVEVPDYSRSGHGGGSGVGKRWICRELCVREAGQRFWYVVAKRTMRSDGCEAPTSLILDR